MVFSFSRAFILDTTFLRSSTTAEARGSTVLMTQLHEVCSFSAYLDRSDVEIPIDAKDRNKKNHIIQPYICIKLCMLLTFQQLQNIFRNARLLTTHKEEESYVVELCAQFQLQVCCGENAAKRN